MGILDAYAGYKKQRANLEKKSRRTDYFLYKKKKKKKNYNTSCLLCSEFRSTYSIYTQNYTFKAHILDTYAGYKKLRPNLEKKSRRTGYFIYKKKKKKKNSNTSCLLCSEFRYTYSIYTQNYPFKAQVIS